MTNIPVVLFGDHIAAYGAIRALVLKNIPIYIVSQSGNGLCTRSKYVKEIIQLNSSDTDFMHALTTWISKKIGSEAVLMVAGDDCYLDVLSKNHAALEPNLKCTFPAWNIVKKVRNKRKTYKIADSIGVPVPKTNYIESSEDLHQMITNEKNLKYPVLMKSENSAQFLQKYRIKGIIADNENELVKYYTKYDGFMGELLVQEFIPGDETNLLNCIGIFNKNAQPVEVFMNRKRRSSGQFLNCTLMETMWSVEVLNYSKQLISAMGFWGYANPEFKYDPRDGGIKLMEVNGRITMSNSHALRCGINIINTLYQEATRGPLNPCNEFKKNYPDDILWWLPIQDIISGLKMIKNGSLKLKDFFRSLSCNGMILEPINLKDLRVIQHHLFSLSGKPIS